MSRLTKAGKQALAEAKSETDKIVSLADEKVKRDSLNTMWAFMEMGAQKPNVPFLIECCERLKRCMTQKTAGQPEYAKAGDERFETSLDQLMNFIIIETMCLWLSGGLEKLKEEQSDDMDNERNQSGNPIA